MTEEFDELKFETIDVKPSSNYYSITDHDGISNIAFRVTDRSIKSFIIVEMFPVKKDYTTWHMTIFSN